MVIDSGSDQAPRAAVGQETAAAGSVGDRIYDIRIDRDGIWHHEGRPISRMPLVKLFASVLRRDDDGAYWLVTPVERGRVAVDDVPFVAVELSACGAGSRQVIRLRSNLDEWVTLGPDHPLHLRTPRNTSDKAPSISHATPIPYVEIRSGLDARLLRPVYYELVDLGEICEQNGIARYGVWSAGRFFPLGRHSP